MVVQLFKNILMMTREFVQLWRKLYILLQTPLPMKLRAKDSVKKVYSCFLCCTGFFWLYSFLKIYKGGLQNLYSFGTKLYILVQTPLSLELRAKGIVPKMYSFFLCLYSSLKIYKGGLQNLYSFGKDCTFCYKHHCE